MRSLRSRMISFFALSFDWAKNERREEKIEILEARRETSNSEAHQKKKELLAVAVSALRRKKNDSH